MLKFRRILFVVSFVLALISTYVGQKVLQKHYLETKVVNYVEIPVAIKNIPANTLIEDQWIQYRQVPKETLSVLTFIRSKEEIVGKVSAELIGKNSLIHPSSLAGQDTLTLFALENDYRAVTFENNELIGVGGALREGMFVDVFWTFTKDGEVSTALAFQNIQVLAVGLPQGNENNAQTITLKVKVKDAQRLTYMASTGSIKFMLRSSGETPVQTSSIINSTNIGIQ